jgi:hypothetical protein
MTETLDFTTLDQFLGIKRLAADAAPASPLGSLVARPSVRSRNSAAFLSAFLAHRHEESRSERRRDPITATLMGTKHDR